MKRSVWHRQCEENVSRTVASLSGPVQCGMPSWSSRRSVHSQPLAGDATLLYNTSFKKDQKGLMSPGTRGADAQGPGWVDDPGAEEVEDLGTHDVGQGADVPVVEDQAAAWWNAQLWLKTIQGWKTQKAQDQEQGTAANLCRFIAIF